MLDIKFVMSNTDEVKSNLNKRGFDLSIIDRIISLNESRKKIVAEVDEGRSQLKQLSKQIGPMKKAGENTDTLMKEVTEIKSANSKLDSDLTDIEEKQHYLLSTTPNLISDDVPLGKTEDDNVEVSRHGEPRQYNFEVSDHVALGENLGMLDFEAAAKVTGSRFVFYKGALARLERALINYMLDGHGDEGYTEVIPPFIVHERSMFGTGQLPKFKDEAFKIEGQDWYLVPTAEVPLTNIKREELFNKSELPIKMCAYTPCFRSEAGSHGKDTRGMIRVHQFNKVEMVNIVDGKNSSTAHDTMVQRACNILESLELPYKAINLCSGDIGFGAQKTIDLEVWLPSQNKYREISSLSNCGDFQARRASIRFRNSEGKPEFAHTLNGSGLAVGRTVVAIMENYQQEDGSIKVPTVLIPYMGGMEVISK